MATVASLWPYRFDDVDFVLTGVDLDADALRIRQEERQDLHAAVVGDLRSVSFDQHSFQAGKADAAQWARRP
jgi:hypothetical protein